MTDMLETIARRAELLLAERVPVLVAIDGCCGSGKTTLAAALAERLKAEVLHMDDFYLRPEQRSPARYRTPGENVDHERFLGPLRPLLLSFSRLPRHPSFPQRHPLQQQSRRQFRKSLFHPLRIHFPGCLSR